MGARLVDRAERLSAIERMLFRNSGGLRAVEIAAACGVDRRTIYRDVDALDKLGIPISQQDGRFFINRDYYLATVRLNFNEAVALFIAARVLSRNAEQQTPHIVSALSKLGGALPEPLSSHISFIADSLRGNPVDRNFIQNSPVGQHC
jgi:predicted DNA-binding transcriptional regulator YafY